MPLMLGRGSTLVVLSVVLVFWTPIVFAQMLQPFEPNAASFETWRERRMPVYMKCFLFNITNVDDILTGKDVLVRVQQLGPYVFRETETKTNISWHENSTVEFYNLRYWHFEPDMSNGSLTDQIVSINPVIVTLSYQVRFKSLLLQIPFDVVLRTFHDNIFLRANVSSWLFDGIDDPVLNFTAQLPNLPHNFKMPYNKFGWFQGRNGSMEYDGSFLMNTGAANISKLGNLEKWKFSKRTVYRDECGEVEGSMGELETPVNGQKLTIFKSDICTYLVLPMVKSVKREGLERVQYATDNTVFNNGHTIPGMACYCDEVRNQDCLPSGALNVSACRFGGPVFVSLPHFLHSDPHYPSKIDGLNPTEAMNFRVTVEKSTGKPLFVVEQLQMNLLVRHVRGMSINNQLPDSDVLVPMFWYEREVRNKPNYERV